MCSLSLEFVLQGKSALKIGCTTRILNANELYFNMVKIVYFTVYFMLCVFYYNFKTKTSSTLEMKVKMDVKQCGKKLRLQKWSQVCTLEQVLAVAA